MQACLCSHRLEVHHSSYDAAAPVWRQLQQQGPLVRSLCLPALLLQDHWTSDVGRLCAIATGLSTPLGTL